LISHFEKHHQRSPWEVSSFPLGNATICRSSLLYPMQSIVWGPVA
jgi:hypothetical protein